jgi:hypothetical protein
MPLSRYWRLEFLLVPANDDRGKIENKKRILYTLAAQNVRLNRQTFS